MKVPEPSRRTDRGRILLLASLLITIFVYWPGLSGSWLFDDYPNIVDNPGVQPHQVSVPALARAALSSPASEFKRPLASLSFAANYLMSGLEPYSWKLVNLIIHLLNGALVYLLAKALLQATTPLGSPVGARPVRDALSFSIPKASRTGRAPTGQPYYVGMVAALIAGGWMLLPINLTGVLYVVQRMESLANLFVLTGLVGYMAGRRHMLRTHPPATRGNWGGFALCVVSLVFFTALGTTAKETAVMLPLYAFLIEWIALRFKSDTSRRDWRLLGMFIVVLVLPLVLGLLWLMPQVTSPGYWSTRDFMLGTRLLSEARVVVDYIAWTVLPTPHALSFYHDQFPVSTGLLSPWTTLASILILAALIVFALWQRNRRPLVSLGIALFLGCQLLTGTILPLELVYEHRNYFASFGVMLAVVPWLVGGAGAAPTAMPRHNLIATKAATAKEWKKWGIWSRHAVLAGLMLWWTGLTATTAYDWGDPLRLAQALATRAPDSPRAQYELGRSYIIYSHYDPSSPYTKLAYAPLERAAAMPESSILPQQALIFMNSRMRLPLKKAWWDSMTAKLKSRVPGVQDESSLQALTQCARDGGCKLPEKRMAEAFRAALDHPVPSARLQATYGDYAWNVMGDRPLGLRMIEAAARAQPDEPAYHITLARMLVALDRPDEARQQIHALKTLNIGGRLDISIAGLQALLPRQGEATAPALQ